MSKGSVCPSTWLPVKSCDCPAHEGSVCWKCNKSFLSGTCITCEICGGNYCEACQELPCDNHKEES